MNVTSGFLVYATLFRISIIAVGLISILLGYHLFIKDPLGQGKTTASFESGSFKLSLRNFWPGAYFALFGTVIISMMLWQGNPELTMEELKKVYEAGSESEVFKVTMRGECSSIDSCWQQLSNPELALSDAIYPMSKIVSIWKNEGRHAEALGLAKLIVKVEPQNPASLSQLALLLWENNEKDKAKIVMRELIKIEPSLAKEFEPLLSEVQN